MDDESCEGDPSVNDEQITTTQSSGELVNNVNSSKNLKAGMHYRIFLPCG